MGKTELKTKISQFEEAVNKMEQNDSRQASSQELAKLFNNTVQSLDNNDNASIQKLATLVDLASQAIDSNKTQQDKMSALIAIQDEINRSKLKAYGLEATAAAVKIVVGFVCTVWAVLCGAGLIGFYAATFPFGMLADIAAIGVGAQYPPFLTSAFMVAAMPFLASQKLLSPKEKKDHIFSSVTEEKDKARTLQNFKDTIQNGRSNERLTQESGQVSQHSVGKLDRN